MFGTTHTDLVTANPSVKRAEGKSGEERGAVSENSSPLGTDLPSGSEGSPSPAQRLT